MIIIIIFTQDILLNHSKQRDLILKILTENPCHPSAETVFALARQYDGSISLATVYRNLNYLAENGIIKKLEKLDNVVRFDHTLTPHHHFICSRCSSVTDIDCSLTADLTEQLSKRTGLNIETADICLHGICSDCLNLNLKS